MPVFYGAARCSSFLSPLLSASALPAALFATAVLPRVFPHQGNKGLQGVDRMVTVLLTKRLMVGSC